MIAKQKGIQMWNCLISIKFVWISSVETHVVESVLLFDASGAWTSNVFLNFDDSVVFYMNDDVEAN